ncbi:site-specific integrase [Cellulomonas cellasea]|uniref:tyrosine-type recombinase/integrase n=1 Tax=Cellulomonas cellasea TaxID=43670 RepID=UPI0025A44ABA|nr:site-specific integrase [Cellulomonas cellasea]MDM8086309.1 site-specific integrase [Cellulomonas cellasea]
MAEQKTRRPHGTGGVYQRASDGLYVATIEAGWTAKGTRRRITVSAKTKRACEAKLKEKQREIAKSGTPVAGVSAKTTVRTWAEQWLTVTETQVRPKTWATNRSAVRTWIIPTIGHRRLDLLAPADIRAVNVAIRKAGRKGSTAVRAHAVLTKMLKDALVEGHSVPPRVLATEGPLGNEADRDAIPLPDALAILAVASERPDSSRWAAAFMEAMRPAEALGLTWSAVDFEKHRIEVSWQLQALPYKVTRDRTSGFRTPDGYISRQLDGALHLVRPKTASGLRVIPMVPWMEAALLAWRDICPASPHGLVWPRPDGRPGSDALDRAAWVEIVDTAQVARVDEDGNGRRYDLYEARHTTASILREAGVDDETITAIMGHSTILSTKAYLHTTDARTREALEHVATRLGLGVPAPRIEA